MQIEFLFFQGCRLLLERALQLEFVGGEHVVVLYDGSRYAADGNRLQRFNVVVWMVNKVQLSLVALGVGVDVAMVVGGGLIYLLLMTRIVHATWK